MSIENPNIINPNIQSIQGMLHPDWIRPVDPEAFRRANAADKRLVAIAQSGFTGIPYGATESASDMPVSISESAGEWNDRPA